MERVEIWSKIVQQGRESPRKCIHPKLSFFATKIEEHEFTSELCPCRETSDITHSYKSGDAYLRGGIIEFYAHVGVRRDYTRGMIYRNATSSYPPMLTLEAPTLDSNHAFRPLKTPTVPTSFLKIITFGYQGTVEPREGGETSWIRACTTEECVHRAPNKSEVAPFLFFFLLLASFARRKRHLRGHSAIEW